MTRKLVRGRGDPAKVLDECEVVSARSSGKPSSQGAVSIVFTPQQVAYLEERMRVVGVRPTRRVGGSYLLNRLPEGLSAT